MKFLQNYMLRDIIGQGGFGVVSRAIKKTTKEEVIVKSIKTSEKMPSEVYFLQKCQKIANIIKLVEFYVEQNTAYLVFESLPNYIDLFDLLDRYFPLNEFVVRHIFQTVVNTVKQMAELDIYHYDIKDENILLSYSDVISAKITPSRVKLIDFGNARYETRYEKSYSDENFCPTRIYSPPEYREHNLIFPNEFTVWTLGCLLVNLLNGDTSRTKREDDWSKDLVDLISKCLKYNPLERIPITDINVL